MRYRKLSPSGDFLFGNGLKDFYIDVPAAVGQAVQTGLTLWLGEWYLNILSGTPFMQGILGRYSQTDADITIQTQVTNTEGVVNYTDFSSTLDPEDRAYSCSMSVNTVYGPTVVTLANYLNY